MLYGPISATSFRSLRSKLYISWLWYGNQWSQEEQLFDSTALNLCRIVSSPPPYQPRLVITQENCKQHPNLVETQNMARAHDESLMVYGVIHVADSRLKR